MTMARFVAGVAGVVLLCGGLGVTGIVVQRRWLGWRGSPARLAEFVVGFAAFVLVAEALGTVSLFAALPLLATVAALAVGVVAAGQRLPRRATADAPPRPSQQPWAPTAAALFAVVTLSQWVTRARDSLTAGIFNVDSRQYHLTFAVHQAQTGDLSRLTFIWLDPIWSFYPENNELPHAAGMLLFGADVASLVVNIGWLVVGLLAAWVLGRPFGVGHLTVAAAAVIFTVPVMGLFQPGNAMSDIPACALLLAVLALLAQGDRRPVAFAVAGLAAGLAIGTKVTVAVPIVAVTIAVVALARRGERWATILAWAGGCFAGGGYWYVRNLVRAGNPVPMLPVPGLARPELPAVEAYGFSVADYLTDGSFWRDFVPAGLRFAFGIAYPLIVLLPVAGVLLAAVTLRKRRRPESSTGAVSEDLRYLLVVLSAAAVVGAIAYAVTPVSAYGPPGVPALFGPNLRYLVPALLPGTVLAALVWLDRPRIRQGVLGLCALLVIVNVASGTRRVPGRLVDQPLVFAAAILAFGVAAWVVDRVRSGAVAWSRRRATVGAVIAGVLLLTPALLLGHRVADGYLERRYTDDEVDAWARTVHDADIAVVGYAEQYPLAGPDLSNRLTYLGITGDHGSFESLRDCAAFRVALHRGGFDFLVVGTNKWGLEPSPEPGWMATDRAATLILAVSGPGSSPGIEVGGVQTAVYEVGSPRGDPAAGCP